MSQFLKTNEPVKWGFRRQLKVTPENVIVLLPTTVEKCPVNERIHTKPI